VVQDEKLAKILHALLPLLLGKYVLMIFNNAAGIIKAYFLRHKLKNANEIQSRYFQKPHFHHIK